ARGLVPIDTPVKDSPLLSKLPAETPVYPDRVVMLEAVLGNKNLDLVEGLKAKAPLRVFTFGEKLTPLLASSSSTKKGSKGTDEQGFMLTARSFTALAGEELPESVLKKLDSLKDRKFTSREQFTAKLAKLLDTDELQRHEDAV